MNEKLYPPKVPGDMSMEELVDLVTRLQRLLYWSPTHGWVQAGTFDCNEIHEVMAECDLTPIHMGTEEVQRCPCCGRAGCNCQKEAQDMDLCVDCRGAIDEDTNICTRCGRDYNKESES
jgi:hypothetical protein